MSSASANLPGYNGGFVGMYRQQQQEQHRQVLPETQRSGGARGSVLARFATRRPETLYLHDLEDTPQAFYMTESSWWRDADAAQDTRYGDIT